jgi:hypothetical protein
MGAKDDEGVTESKALATVQSPEDLASGIQASVGRDTLETVVQGALGAIPFAGGFLSSVVATYSNRKRSEKIADAISFLADEVKKGGRQGRRNT